MRKRGSSVWLSVATTLLLVAGGIPAKASPITWSLSNVTFQDGGSATGTITYDATTATLEGFSITLTDDNFSLGQQITLSSAGIMNGADGPYSSSGSAQTIFGTSDVTTQYNLYSYIPGQTGVSAMQLYVGGTSGGGALYEPTNPPDGRSYVIYDNLTTNDYTTNIVTGTLIAQSASTPEPSGLVLLGTGLTGLVGMIIRRKRAGRVKLTIS